MLPCFRQVDQADEETDFREDARQRERTASRMLQRAKETQEALGRLGELRALTAIRKEFKSEETLPLATYHRSCTTILELLGPALAAIRQQETTLPAASTATESSASLLHLAGRIRNACQQHVERGVDGLNVSDQARRRMEHMDDLVTRPSLFAQVEAEITSQSANPSFTETTTDIGSDGGRVDDIEAGQEGKEARQHKDADAVDVSGIHQSYAQRDDSECAESGYDDVVVTGGDGFAVAKNGLPMTVE